LLLPVFDAVNFTSDLHLVSTHRMTYVNTGKRRSCALNDASIPKRPVLSFSQPPPAYPANIRPGRLRLVGQTSLMTTISQLIHLSGPMSSEEYRCDDWVSRDHDMLIGSIIDADPAAR
jgi:hypothetical protein